MTEIVRLDGGTDSFFESVAKAAGCKHDAPNAAGFRISAGAQMQYMSCAVHLAMMCQGLSRQTGFPTVVRPSYGNLCQYYKWEDEHGRNEQRKTA